MKINLSLFILPAIITLLLSCEKAPEPPAPYGAIPTPIQVEWQKMEYYMFIHFGPNTFTDMEWGHGDEDPKVFNPTRLDCRQWAATAKAAGMKAIIITAKHHDGFCLWPSNYSTHTVRESAWKDGKGDVLKELSEACKDYGLKFGVYLSPWDRNHPAYGTDEYNEVFANTLTEALSNYGQVFEQWFDGANGEGPNGKKQVYDWDKFISVVNNLQADAVIFGSPYRTIRWIGNESGYANKTNWSTFIADDKVNDPTFQILGRGIEGGDQWLPAEVDVSIRPGWFFSSSTNDKVKSVGKLMDIYYSSVGRNSNLLLNVPPDRNGLIHPNDSVRLIELRKVLDESFKTNLINGAKAKANNVRGSAKKYSEKNLFDNNYDSYWTTDDDKLSASIEISLNGKQTFNRIVLQEYIPLGQRVKSFNIEYWNNDKWDIIDKQTTIGYKRILCFPMITTEKIRINIEESLACPVLNEVALYKAVEILETPTITRNKEGKVYIHSESKDPVIYYTIDGSEPTVKSTHYSEPFDLPEGGIVTAKAFINNNSKSSESVRADYDVAASKWVIVSPTGHGAQRAIDGNPNSGLTIPADQGKSISINLGEELNLKGFNYTPINGANGNIYRYNFYVSNNGKQWTKVKSNAAFDNIRNNPISQFVRFDETIKASFIKLESVETVEPNERIVIGEIGILTK